MGNILRALVLTTVVMGFMSAASAMSVLPDWRTEVEPFRMSLDNDKLTVRYKVGGGCEKHHGELAMDFNAETNTLSLRVIDVSPKQDMCRSYQFVEQEFDLAAQIKSFHKTSGVTGEIKVILPSTTVYIPEEVAPEEAK